MEAGSGSATLTAAWQKANLLLWYRNGIPVTIPWHLKESISSLTTFPCSFKKSTVGWENEVAWTRESLAGGCVRGGALIIILYLCEARGGGI